MGTTTNIDWCDTTVNPTTGCVGCELKTPGKSGTCYASTLHEGRLAKSLPHLYAADFHEVRLAPGRMAKAAALPDLRGKERPGKPWLNGMPRMIFVGDMGDIFSPDVPFEYLRDEVLAAAASKAGKRHNWLWLTKQPKRMRDFTRLYGPLPDNVWAGVSVTKQEAAWRAADLLEVEAKVRFVSAEPLLGPICYTSEVLIPADGDHPNRVGYMLGKDDGKSALHPTRSKAMAGIHWVIFGGESGPNARACNIEWIRSGVRQCKQAGVKAFVKQLGAKPTGGLAGEWTRVGAVLVPTGVRLRDPKGGDPYEWPEDLRVREVPE